MAEAVTPVVPPGGKDTDPSALTREMILRETSQVLREIEQVRREIELIREIVDTRLNAMDKALEKVEQFPTEVDQAFNRLKELHDGRFNHVDSKFAGVETRFLEGREELRTAQSKTEESFTKQIDGIVSRIGDVKERITVIESLKKGGADSAILLFGAIGAVVGAIGIISFLAK